MALIEMGDFVGAVLKHIKKVEQDGSVQLKNATQLTKLSICGGFGKISKLAQGNMDLNSRVSSIDLGALAELAVTLGADQELQETHEKRQHQRGSPIFCLFGRARTRRCYLPASLNLCSKIHS